MQRSICLRSLLLYDESLLNVTLQLGDRLIGPMVLTRRLKVRVATTEEDTFHVKSVKAVVEGGEPPRKKQRVVENKRLATSAQSKKKAKALLKTLHTEDALLSLRQKATRIYEKLLELYPDPPCPLDHGNAFQLLCSVILSAQSTDKKVNEVVPPLYAIAPDAPAMAALDVSMIEDYIRKIGLAPTKAKNISNMSKALVERHSGTVPDTFEELEQLAGVGHKTASVVLSVAFNKPTFPVDTHIYRLALRWGLTSGKTVEQAEADLKVCWPEEDWNPLHLRLIYFGREHCPAQRHDPTVCPICKWAAVAPYSMVGRSPMRAGSRRQP